MGLILHIDGASRGNPGPAGAGVVISSEDGTLIHEGAYYLGRQTNNAAEYHALIRALRRAGRCGEQTVTVCSDSELLVRQITGQYRVKSAKLAQLFRQAQLLLLRICCWNVQHVPREATRRADELANLAIDQGRDLILFDAGAGQQARQTPPANVPPGDDETDSRTAPAPADRATRAGPNPDPACASGLLPTETDHGVRVTPAKAPNPDVCPAAGCPSEPFTVESTLPAAICIHAAHALLPTIVAILNTVAAEFAAVPTLTVRCMRAGCGASFHVSPAPSSNGAARGSASS